MRYEDALKVWGKKKIEDHAWSTCAPVDVDTVKVSMDFYGGYACCGGRNADCYCSQAESPRSSVLVEAQEEGTGLWRRYEMDIDDFDFETVLGEILAAADGMIHNLEQGGTAG